MITTKLPSLRNSNPSLDRGMKALPSKKGEGEGLQYDTREKEEMNGTKYIEEEPRLRRERKVHVDNILKNGRGGRTIQKIGRGKERSFTSI